MYQNLLGQSFIPVTPEVNAGLLYLFHASERYPTGFCSGAFAKEVSHQALRGGVLVTQV